MKHAGRAGARDGTAGLPERPGLEMWGGVECTINRVGDRYFDQSEMTGHARRPGDLQAVAALGIKTLRYPVLWERVCASGPGQEDWSFADDRLSRLRELGIRPIVGLLHHGSGPRWTGLADPGFPAAFAAFARKVARRFPWVEDFIPINEPLTTARFTSLYGHWHPHAKDERAFFSALIAQCRGIVLAMRSIREVTPRARLITTEDLGKTHSTPPLAYQAAFENERRWLSYDLLCGRADKDHFLWRYMLDFGVPEADLRGFQEHPCPPDILGFNHYLTGERFLDHRPDRYPARYRGGNGREAYADVEAVRVREAGIQGPAGLLREAWDRYTRPMAVTEAQLGCTREDQVRWLREVWMAAQGLARDGVDIRAVTAWSLFGACEWNSLVTREDGHYEPGAFDVRAPRPRPTALAGMISSLAAGRVPSDPLSSAPGWWHREDRFFRSAWIEGDAVPSRPSRKPAGYPRTSMPPVLITGCEGTLGRALASACRQRGIRHIGLPRSRMDIADSASVEKALSETGPWSVINAAGYVRVDDAESEPEKCRRENAFGPSVLAEACSRSGVRLMTFSSDLVFDGQASRPYLESAPVSPLNTYGRTKAEAERKVLELDPGALIIRTSAFFGPKDPHNFLARTLAELRIRGTLDAVDDITVSPTYLPGLADACLDLFLDGEKGVWHLTNAGAMTWAGLARFAARFLGYGEGAVRAVPSKDTIAVAPRPHYSVLGSERGWILPPLESALELCLRELVA